MQYYIGHNRRLYGLVFIVC